MPLPSPHSSAPSNSAISRILTRGSHSCSSYPFVFLRPVDDDEKLDKIGILLNEAEASDMMDRCGHTGGFLLAPDLRERFYHISGGHAGCLAALIGVFGRTPVSMNDKNIIRRS